MCRMLALMSRKLLDTQYLMDFRQLAEIGKVANGRRPGHKDGWGIVAYANNVPRYMGRQPANAIEDPEYENVCRSMHQQKIRGVVLCQLRKRSVGMKNILNTPPLIARDFCFMHNGTVHDLGNRNESDSVQFFRLILKELDQGKTVGASLRSVYSEIAATHRFTSITSILSDGKSIYATKCLSPNQNEEYYDLMYAREGDLFVISQEKTWPLNWRRINNGEMLTIDSNMQVTCQQID